MNDPSRPYHKTYTIDLDRHTYDGEQWTYLNLPIEEIKEDRIRTFASASSHAMTLMAVDLDEQGRPKKWMVENSWGASSGHRGHLIMTDEWFDEYMFRLVVENRFVPKKTLRLLEQKPTLLPAWDPLFAPEQ